MQTRSSGVEVVRNVALVAVPVVVAVVVALVIVSMRDRDRSTGREQGSAPAPTTAPADPAVARFCQQTEATRDQIQQFVQTSGLGSGQEPEPLVLAQLLEDLELDQIDPAAAPEAIRDDLAFLLSGRDRAVEQLRVADGSTQDILEAVEPALINSMSEVLTFHIGNCPQS